MLLAGMYLSRPVEQQERMCKNQIVRSSSGTISFSVLGVTIILILGTALIVTSLILPIVVGFLRERLRWKEHKSLQWAVDGKLQFQRLSYEEAAQGHWSGGVSSVPLTRKNDLLGLPGGVDTTHPRLGRVQRSHSDIGSVHSGTLERESLVGDKGMTYKVETLVMQHGQ